MTLRSYLAATLRFYWRTNAAIIAGVAAATAVIGGALLVGASMRSSLERMTLDRLARVDHVLSGGRFFREELSESIATGDADKAFDIAPGIILPGSLTAEQRDGAKSDALLRRTGGLMVYGVDQRFWEMTKHGDLAPPEAGEVILNRRAADELGVATGDSVSLVVEIPPSIPRDSLLGERSETVVELSLKVTGIADDKLTQGRFGLNPTQQLPRNAFVSLAELQEQLGLAAKRATARGETAQPARVNTLFAAGKSPDDDQASFMAPDSAERLTQQLADVWTLEDLALRIVQNDEHGYCSLESRQLILDTVLSDAATKSAQELQLRTSPVLVYLINEINNPAAPEADKAYSMYAVAAGIEFSDRPPFGPFDWTEPPNGPIGAGELVINDWLAQDLKAKRGDTVHVKYHQVGDRGELPELEADFQIAGIVRLTGVADDRGYTPEVPGITDVKSLEDWRQPFPLKLNRVTARDDAYWDPQDQTRKAYRATPKIFLPLAEAQRLWESRYGNVTSFRFAPAQGQELAAAADRFQQQFLQTLRPEQAGLAFQPVKYQGLQAAAGTTDFAGLFTGFSFFLILAAAILVGLLFRLNLEQRLPELGLLSAVGFAPVRTRRLMLGEGAALIAAGGVLGAALAIGFAALMIHGLTTWWVGAVGTTFLSLRIDWVGLATGVGIAAVVAGIAIYWALRRARQVSTRSLLAGSLEPSVSSADRSRRRPQGTSVGDRNRRHGRLLWLARLSGLVPQKPLPDCVAGRGVLCGRHGGSGCGVAALAGTPWRPKVPERFRACWPFHACRSATPGASAGAVC
ncbi:MAG: ABC transporter permease [Planctomycetaceae bacterium]